MRNRGAIKPGLLPMPSAITDAASGRARISPKKEIRRRGYFTTRSSGRRGWSCVCLDGGGGSLAALRSISSHNARRSALSIPLSFIRTSRMTIESSSADSRLLLSLRTLRHSSSVSSTDCNCSECDTAFFPLIRPARRACNDPLVPHTEQRIARGLRALEYDFSVFLRRNRDSNRHRPATRAANVEAVKDETLKDETSVGTRLIHSAKLREISRAALRSRQTRQSRSHFKARNGTHATPLPGDNSPDSQPPAHSNTTCSTVTMAFKTRHPRNPPWLWFALDSASLAVRKDLYALLGGKGRSTGRTPKNKSQRPLGLGCGSDISGSGPMRQFPLGGRTTVAVDQRRPPAHRRFRAPDRHRPVHPRCPRHPSHR